MSATARPSPPACSVLTISGPARAVLAGERTALNFVGRLSGIATLTSDYVRHTAGTKMRICCTRKTTPGLRALEKYAVRCGGGFNHRFGLDDAILIKDNHIAVAGGIRPVLERARAHIGHLVKVEIEVDNLDQLREVLDTGLADVVLLDNMDIATLTEAVKLASGRVVLEASGGVTPEFDREDRRHRRRLCLVRRADAFGAEFRRRAGYRCVSFGSRATAAPSFPINLGRALRFFRELRRNLRGLLRRSPARRVAAVAPGARPVEGVHAEFVHLLHFADPGRVHPIGMVVRRFRHFRQPELAVEHRLGDLLGAVPHVGLAHDIGDCCRRRR